MEEFKILVAGCDNNADLFEPFHHCMEKYWFDHPEIYYSTETVINPYYKTICNNLPINKWTKRIREAAKQIDSEYIVLMVDDIFLQNEVNSNEITNKIQLFVNNIAAIHIQPSSDANDLPYFNNTLIKNPRGKYQTSVCCSLWKKSALLDVLSVGDFNPWEFEIFNQPLQYVFLTTKNGLLSFGKTSGKNWKDWGVFRGKWAPTTLKFLQDEGLNIDASKRGVAEV